MNDVREWECRVGAADVWETVLAASARDAALSYVMRCPERVPAPSVEDDFKYYGIKVREKGSTHQIVVAYRPPVIDDISTSLEKGVRRLQRLGYLRPDDATDERQEREPAEPKGA